MMEIWESGDVKLYLGDVMDGLAVMPDESVHCVVTSPPYWGLRDYGVDGQIGLEPTPEAFIERMTAVFREVRRVLRCEGTCWVNMGDSYAAQRGGTSMPAETLAGGVSGQGDGIAKRGRGDKYCPHRNAASLGLKHKDLIGIPWRLAFALQADGWYLRSDIIWHKPNPMPESVTDRPTKAHEYVFLLTKSAKYYYDAAAIAEKADISRAGQLERSFSTSDPLSSLRQDVGRAVMRSMTRNKRTVWTIPTESCSEAHFATFPRKLVEPCILAGCPTDGVVLDPFTGSGTTCLVAIQHGRGFHGIELNPEYFQIAKRRIQQAQADKANEMPLVFEADNKPNQEAFI